MKVQRLTKTLNLHPVCCARDDDPSCGLLVDGDLGAALRLRPFRDVADDLARAFVNDRARFDAVRASVNAITG